jgi:hypothetical protein
VRKDVVWLGHSPRTMAFTDGEFTDVRLENVVSELAKVNDVALRLRMRPHAIIHRGHDQHRCLSREQARGQEITCLAPGRTGHEISRCRCDDHEFSGSRQSDVIERVTCLDQLRVNGAPSQCFECDRADELGGGLCEDDVDFSRRLREQACQPRRLVAGYPSRYAEKDAAA